MAHLKNPYLADYEVDAAFRLPDKFDPNKVNGLESCLIVERSDPPGRMIASIWEDKIAFDENHAELIHQAGISQECSKPKTTGLVRKTIRRKSFSSIALDRGKIGYLLLIHAAALFGLLATYRNYYDFLMAAPSVVVDTEKPHYDVAAGNQAELTFRVRNVERSGPCKVEFDRPDVKTEAGQPVDFKVLMPSRWPVPFALVSPDQTRGIAVRLDQLPPGKYAVTVMTHTMQGRWRTARDVPIVTELEIWRPIAVSFDSVEPTTTKRCKVIFTVKCGAVLDPGREIQAIVERAPGVRFSAVSFPNVFDWDQPVENQTPGHETASISWKLPKMESYKEHHFSLMLSSSVEQDEQSWKSAAAKIRFLGLDE